MQVGENLLTYYGLFSVCYLMLLALFATWPAAKAFEKGRHFLKWYLFGVLLFPVALILSFLIDPAAEKNK